MCILCTKINEKCGLGKNSIIFNQTFNCAKNIKYYISIYNFRINPFQIISAKFIEMLIKLYLISLPTIKIYNIFHFISIYNQTYIIHSNNTHFFKIVQCRQIKTCELTSHFIHFYMYFYQNNRNMNEITTKSHLHPYYTYSLHNIIKK